MYRSNKGQDSTKIIVKNSCLLNDKDNCATCGNRVYTITGCNSCGRLDCIKCIGRLHEKRLNHPKFQKFIYTCLDSYDAGFMNMFLSICKCGARYVCNCDCYDCKTYRESHKLINVKSNKSRLTYRFRHPVELYPELSNSLSYVQCLFEKFANKYCDSDYFFFDKEYNEQKHVQIIDSEDEGNSNDN
ncbi:hypothetical protein RFI_39254, partial [Reticulomyxa filosa]